MTNTPRYTVGVLYPGEMGSSLGKLMAEAGCRVVTTTETRSHRTQRLCREAGLMSLPSARDVFDESDVLISLVSPAAAIQVAREVAAIARQSPKAPLYLDANSTSPQVAGEVAGVMRSASLEFVDGCIFGLASQLRQRGAVYLSGYRAPELTSLFGQFMRVKVVGSEPGQASAFKMIISGIPKGLSALMIEILLFAREMGMLDQALASCNETYPALMEVVNRMLPTYPQHAGRRCEELREVQHTMLMNGVSPRMIAAACDVTSDMASADWDTQQNAKQWTVAEVIEALHRERALHAIAPASDST